MSPLLWIFVRGYIMALCCRPNAYFKFKVRLIFVVNSTNQPHEFYSSVSNISGNITWQDVCLCAPYPPCHHPPPVLVIALLSLGSSSVCAVPLYVKKEPVNFMICHTSASLRRAVGDWVWTSLSRCSFLPPLPDWSHITYPGCRTELVSTCYWE